MRRRGDAETRRCSWRYKFPRKPKETPSFWTRTLIFDLHNNVILNVDKHLFELHGHRFPQSEKVWVIISVWQKLCEICNQSHDGLHATSATSATSHMTGCMQPVTSATRHVTGCTHRASIRSVRQKLSSKMQKCGDAEVRRCGDAETQRCSWRYKFPRKPR